MKLKNSVREFFYVTSVFLLKRFRPANYTFLSVFLSCESVFLRFYFTYVIKMYVRSLGIR